MKSASKTTPSINGKRALATKARKQPVTVIGPLRASSLRDVLWETLNDVRTNQMQPNRADAIATQAREILRTVKTQLNVASVARRGIPSDLIKFSES
jgi:hypothetical protein